MSVTRSWRAGWQPAELTRHAGRELSQEHVSVAADMIAAEMSARSCYGLELNPAYVDVIVRRWQLFTGRAAIHQASGQPFDERAAAQGQDQSDCADG